jgi:hypothetical protein
MPKYKILIIIVWYCTKVQSGNTLTSPPPPRPTRKYRSDTVFQICLIMNAAYDIDLETVLEENVT